MKSIGLKQGDVVVVITGKDKGKHGKILRVDRVKGRVLVEGVNIVKKTQKPRREGEKGKIVSMEVGIDISNVMVKCTQCGPVRVRSEILKDGGKDRLCVKCGRKI